MADQTSLSSLSAPLWANYTIETWRRFVSHDWDHPSRKSVYHLIPVLLNSLGIPRPTLAEIGFGGAYDFKQCFKGLHDSGSLRYSGFDATPEFVEYAKTDFPDYTWNLGQFSNLGSEQFDITYTRHTLQHQSPETIEDCIRSMLGPTDHFAVIVWHPPLSNHHVAVDDWGGYCNTWDKQKIDALIRACGFDITEQPAGEDVIYVMKRHG